MLIIAAKLSILGYPDNCPPEENCPAIRFGVSVKVRVSFTVGEQPDHCPEENCLLLRVRVWARVTFGVWGNFSRGQLS